MKSSLIIMVSHAMLLALLLLGLFMARAMYQPFYYNELIYSLSILLTVLITLSIYHKSLIPNIHRGEGAMSWYLLRAWSMSFTGVLLATLLVGIYAYQVDDGYFNRRIGWEEQRLDKEKLSLKVEDIMLEQAQYCQIYHFEEITIFFLGGLSGVLGAVGVSLFFRGLRRRGGNLPTEQISPG